jgi:hypothetical protein
MTPGPPVPGVACHVDGRTMLGGGSLPGLDGLAEVSPILAVTGAIVMGLVVIRRC